MQDKRSTTVIIGARSWRWIIGLVAGALVALVPAATESAIANGDTRSLSLVHAHTHETITATFKVDGQYDQAVLDKLNWFLRDWRRDEPTHMDARLFDVVWEVYRESGSQQPIMVMSAYRSPETNAMLRRRSRQVAEHSQHILGRAMDQHYMDVPMSRIRELGMKLQRGGVGFYPTAGTPFVHLDVGGIRHWPRMNYDQLARLFPDGKTVHIPSNGVPLPGYEQAREELASRGDDSYPTVSQLKSKGFFAWLFGGGGGDEADDDETAGIKSRGAHSSPAGRSTSPPPAAQVFYSGGKNASDHGGPYAYLNNTRPAATPPVVAAMAPPPAPILPPAPAPALVAPPLVPTIPQQAVALAVPPAPSSGDPETGNQQPIKSLPVPLPSLLPLPPRRPPELAAIEPAAPLPPARPAELMARAAAAAHDATPATSVVRKGDPIGFLLATNRVPHLPDVITQGNGKSGSRLLGYTALAGLADQSRGTADAAIPMPVARPTTLMSTHLDRSNFRSLTRPEATDRSTGRSALGAATPPLRAATRSDLGALTPLPSAKEQTFDPRPPDLATNRFSGVVNKPVSHTALPAKTSID